MTTTRVTSGSAGLDVVLDGGLLPQGSYLLRGGPGSGKTTLGLQFVMGGAPGEGLLVSLGESMASIQKNAADRGMDLSSVGLLDLSPTPELFSEVQKYDLFAPAEVERAPMTQRLVAAVDKLKPKRVFVDAITQFRYLADSPSEFRRQVLSFLNYLVQSGATVVVSSEGSSEIPDDDLCFMVDGVIDLTAAADGRWLTVTKCRGTDFRSGRHGVRLSAKGVEVFPRLNPARHARDFTEERFSTGVKVLDEMSRGGLVRGTVTFLSGPPGVGKSTLSTHFAKASAERGERAVIFSFEERDDAIALRCKRLGARQGTDGVVIQEIEPAELIADEFSALLREEVEQRHARMVILDSVAGFRSGVRGAELTQHLHRACRYLRNMGVNALLLHDASGFGRTDLALEERATYLADNIVSLEYFERERGLGRAIGVLKMRMGAFNNEFRAFELGQQGLEIGAPVTEVKGLVSLNARDGGAP